LREQNAFCPFQPAHPFHKERGTDEANGALMGPAKILLEE